MYIGPLFYGYSWSRNLVYLTIPGTHPLFIRKQNEVFFILNRKKWNSHLLKQTWNRSRMDTLTWSFITLFLPNHYFHQNIVYIWTWHGVVWWTIIKIVPKTEYALFTDSIMWDLLSESDCSSSFGFKLYGQVVDIPIVLSCMSWFIPVLLWEGLYDVSFWW